MKHKKLLTLFVLLCVVGMVFSVACFAQDEDVPAGPKKLSLMGLLKQGGWAMIPLGLCSFLLVAMVVMNFRQVSTKKMMPAELVTQIRAAASKQDFGTVWNLSNSADTFFTKALTAGLRRIDLEDPASSKVHMEEAIGEVIGREESQVSFWINFMSLISAISPMLGLLGTVSGMIKAFQKIGQSGMGRPELLAGNIGEALITTATGLTIAIPALFFYFLFRNMLNKVIMTAEEEYSYILDDITGTGISSFVQEEEVVEEEIVEEITE